MGDARDVLTESSPDQVCGHGMAFAIEIGMVSCTANTCARPKTCSRKLLKLVS